MKSASPEALSKEEADRIKSVTKNGNWNDPCDLKNALVTETWREFADRKERLHALRDLLQSGNVTSVDQLILNNLDISQFVQDVIENCDDINALGVLYSTLSKMTVLDPTCGSGAFIFAALNLLEPIYEACIEKMQSLYSEATKRDQEKSEELRSFRVLLDTISNHPNRSFFIIKSAILNNLYGVDIMKEAVEVCKLRLFLKLAAQVERIEDVEPLPDIDFNFRSGNTLIGFLSKEDLDESVSSGGRQLRLKNYSNHFLPY